MKNPHFYCDDLAGNLYMPRYQLIEQEAQVLAKNFVPAVGSKTALFVIDVQVCFCLPGAALYVPGAEADAARLCQFIFKNMEQLTQLYFSLDTHTVHQIFHSAFWRDNSGNNPPPMTAISYEDVAGGKWIPRFAASYALNYVKQLAETGKYQLILWPYHGQKGGVDAALLPVLSETAFLHSRLYGHDSIFITKGESKLTESYSVLNSEIINLTGDEGQLKAGESHLALLETLMCYDKVYVAGEASSHCVLATLEDIVKNVRDTQLLKKIYIVEDCMSPVPAIAQADFPALAQQALLRFQKAGMHIIKSTDAI